MVPSLGRYVNVKVFAVYSERVLKQFLVDWVSLGQDQVDKLPPCVLPRSSAINNSPRADVWPAGVFVASLGIVRHLSFREQLKVLNRPGHGTSFGKQTIYVSRPKGTFKARTSKGIFSQFSCLPYRRAPKVAFHSGRKTILLRAVSAHQKAMSTKVCHSESG